LISMKQNWGVGIFGMRWEELFDMIKMSWGSV
jgi:hypothetical protein